MLPILSAQVRSCLTGGALLLTWLCVSAARADEAYFVMVFGSQQIPPRVKCSHSFATFVKATGQGPCLESYRLEAHTISWLPQSLDVRPAALLPECGRNLDLDSTLQWALSTGQRVSMWGPYPIDRALYCRALDEIEWLEGGHVRYKAIDAGYPARRVSNCIHAVGASFDGQRIHIASPSFGETASYFLTLRMQPWILDTQHRYAWVSSRLGLDRYPIVPRALENPRSSAILWHLDEALGRHGGPETCFTSPAPCGPP